VDSRLLWGVERGEAPLRFFSIPQEWGQGVEEAAFVHCLLICESESDKLYTYFCDNVWERSGSLAGGDTSGGSLLSAEYG
jgi:hypothetical protein